MNVKNLLVAAVVLIAGNTYSQQNGISIKADTMKLLPLVRLIERQAPVHFYFDEADTDSLRFTADMKDQDLQQALTILFSKTPFRFSISNKGEVFITRDYRLFTRLPRNYFNPSLPGDDISLEQSGLGGIQDGDRKTVAVSDENRLIEFGDKNADPTGKASFRGFVRDIASGEPVSGATVNMAGVSGLSNEVGYFTLTIPKGRHQLLVTRSGLKDYKRQIALFDNGEIVVEMSDFIVILKAVTVDASQRTSSLKSSVMGVERMDIKTIRQVPVLFGEADVLRAVMALPGVTSVGEASTGFNVRGGSADQNLILFNDATIYNPSHFFGFFSAFNPDVVKGIELYKSSIPEKFGGRISSVLDVAVKDGNKKKFSGSGGIGPLTSHLTLEGPLKKEKSSFIIGGRSTYSDWLLGTLPKDEFEGSKASFYDFNANFTQQVGKSDFVTVTGYLSKDKFRLGADTTYRYGNTNVNLKWKHNFRDNTFAVFTAGYDGYDFAISSESNPLTSYDLKFKIQQKYFRADFTKAIGAIHRINFGLNTLLYDLSPGEYTAKGSESLATPKFIQKEKALESALYVGDEIKINQKLSVNAGLRYSLYSFLGPSDVRVYAEGVPRDESTITDTALYGKGRMIRTYHGPEIRVSARYLLDATSSIKFSYNTLRQYIHMLSNTTAITPTDIWKLSDTHIKPQLGQQLSLGFYKTFPAKEIETSVEIYYKRLRNYLDYKSGALLVLNEHIETDVLSSRGKSYGVELMVRKNAGKLNGWISYTYSRTLLRTDDALALPPVNRGEYYPANFDKPHSLNLIGNYRISHRLSISLNGVYSTGRPITLPIAIYNYGGADRVYYSDRNKFRIPDYFRTDLSMNIEGNHKKAKLAHSSWTLGVYNLTARKNPYSVYFVSNASGIKGYKLSIFGSAIPFLTYNFKF